MRLDRDRAREHLRAGPRRRQDPGEAERVAAGDDNPRRLRRRGSQIAGDALGEAAGAQDEDVARLRHMLFSVAAAVSAAAISTRPEPYQRRPKRTRNDLHNGRRGDHRRRPDGLLLGLLPAPARMLGRRDREGQACAPPRAPSTSAICASRGATPRNFPCRFARMRSGRTLPGSPARTAASFPAGTCIWDLRASDQPKLERAAQRCACRRPRRRASRWAGRASPLARPVARW